MDGYDCALAIKRMKRIPESYRLITSSQMNAHNDLKRVRPCPTGLSREIQSKSFAQENDVD